MEFILNEYSLKGQYASMEDFIDDLRHTAGCIKLIHEKTGANIYKTCDFYNAKVTSTKRIRDLKKAHATDELIRFQTMLDNEIYSDPYWDETFQQDLDDARYFWNDKCVTATAMAEAAATGRQLISFKYEGLVDCGIDIIERKDLKEYTHALESIFTKKYLVERFWKELGISRDEYIKTIFQGTRIDYSTIEDGYGADILEVREYNLLLSTLKKFVEHESFETIIEDSGLNYKDYKPEQKEHNWFSAKKYKRFSIMKFRYSNKMRVFGYRKGETFCVLRIERDHKVSDYG